MTTLRPLTPTDRKRLRSLAHHLTPVANIGKAGVNDAVLLAVNQALENHELIKVKFQDFKIEKKALSARIADEAPCHQVGLIGNIALFYRQNEDPERRKIEL